jgi:hypothetical protein
MTDSPDPAAAVRTMLDQWLAMSAAVAEKTLGVAAAAGAPRADLAAIDARLTRIEALLVALAAATINRDGSGAIAGPGAFVSNSKKES